MKRVVIESPYAGDVKRNLAYAKKCMHHSLSIGEAPLASHLLYTHKGVLDDSIIEQRINGINAGLAWAKYAETAVFYVDYGMSNGMRAAMDFYIENKIPVEARYILKIKK